jgi:predicted Zn finger-like uncharacterized protein
MVITCASCLTKFNLSDSQIPSKGVKVRCSRCQHVFYVVPPPETKEEVMEDFQSFAKFHEDLMVPGEAPAKGPVQAKKEEFTPTPSKEEEGPPPMPKSQEPAPKLQEAPAPETEPEPFLFGEKTSEEMEREEIFPEKGERVEPRPPLAKEKARRREKRGFSPLLAIVVFLLILIFGLFYLWTELQSGGKISPYLSAPLQKVEELWGKVWGTEKEGLNVGDLTGYEEKVGDTPLFIIEGKVSNQSRYVKKQIKVKVVLFDQDKVKMAEKEAICGRILSRQELKGQPPAFFKGEMIVKPQNETEAVVFAGKIVPFMVIFRDPMSQAREFKVEIIEAPNQ